MATYVNNLRLKEIATGDESGTWGTSTNTNLELIGEALGIGTEAITTNADTHSTVVADGSADAGRAMYLKYTGALDSDCTITITPNTMKRVQIIENATSGSQNIIISQGSGANVTIGNGKVAIVQLDGAGSGAAVLDVLTDLQVTDTLSVNGTTITLGDGTAEDTKLVYDGNAQDFYIALDDSADDLLIGLGSTVGTTPIISFDENKDVAIPDGGLTITTADNTSQLTLISTDADASPGPVLDLYRNSGSPADNDSTGRINFQGENSAGETIAYSQVFSSILDVTDGTEDGRYKIGTMVAGSFDSRMDMINTETVFNDDSKDLDFRVESNGNANMLVVDGGSDFVSIGTATDYDAVLNVLSTDNTKTLSLVSTDTDANVGPILALTRQSSSSAADNDYVGEIKFEGLNDGNSQIAYAGIAARIVDASAGTEDGRFEMYTELAGAQISRVLANATETVINQDSADLDFRVESDGNANMLFVDGGNDTVGIGAVSSAAPFQVSASPSDTVGTVGISLKDVDNAIEFGLRLDATSKDLHIDRYYSGGWHNNMTFDRSSGNVGIGTSSPEANSRLHIKGASSANLLVDAPTDNASLTLQCGSSDTGDEGAFVQFTQNTTAKWQMGMNDDNSFRWYNYNTLSEAMRIDSSGNVGIGNTIGSFHSSVLPLIVGSGSGDEGMAIYSGNSSKGKIGFADAATDDSGSYRGYLQYDHSGDNLNIGTAGSERIRITSDGKVFIGDSTFGGTAAVHAVEVPASGAGCLIRVDSAANTSETMLQFQDAASQALGSITSNPSANTTLYNTSSDGRLKDITGEAKGLEIINALNPVAFTWKSSGVKAEGLIAQEVEKLVDHAVSETKESEYLQMDYSKLVTPLIKAVQELSAEVEQLKQQAHEKCEN